MKFIAPLVAVTVASDVNLANGSIYYDRPNNGGYPYPTSTPQATTPTPAGRPIYYGRPNNGGYPYLATRKLPETLARVPYSQSIIDRISLSAVERGNVEMVKMLGEHISMGFGNALNAAVPATQLTSLYYSVGEASKKAVSDRNSKIAKLLTQSCRRYDGSSALLAAARIGKQSLLRWLWDSSHSDQKTIQLALKNVSSDMKTKATKALLKKSDPAASTAIFMNAAADGYTELMQQMMDTVDSRSLTRALATAVTGVAVDELLRNKCNPSTIRNAVVRAKADSHDEAAQVLQAKRARSRKGTLHLAIGWTPTEGESVK
ncbi:hypothetical protein ON010_g3380 [Phytophthora cinnamomi]|nr:hypothetical protein ON010_g3380 [Phytophthora cinnamomi]